MQSTYISPVPRAIIQRVDANSRLNWLLAANDYEARRRRLFRTAYEEEQMLLMRHKVSTERTYALFGLLLGAFPPAAVFVRLFGYGLVRGSMNMETAGGVLCFLCVVMNVMCCLMGYAIGSAFSRNALELEHKSWIRMFLLMPLLGAGWGAVTGAAGGFFFFGVGAFFGAAVGIPVGFLGFLTFSILHRILERGGMIETRHFLPIACGITAIVTSLILGL